MNGPSTIYGPSLALLADLYELTMAQGYWKLGRHDDRAVFHLFFRRPPFGGGYTLAAGLGYVQDYLDHLGFTADDTGYLATFKGNDDRPLFDRGFLDYLEGLAWTLDVDAVPEGTVVFPQEPLVRVTGPILQAQIVESALLNLVNFQTLVATKAARVCAAAGGPVLEFGLRRAQGIDGALAASRAAYIGGCAATSNVLAGKLFGMPVKGTHAHSWVMFFDSEPEAFAAYADALPNNCVFLVDTYDSLQGVRHAIEAGRRLRARGHEMVGVRLDSGDLGYLSVQARKLLDEAGFPEARILASNDLDEYIIASLHQQHAAIAVWGVGTKLVTASDDPALGGVYKLAAVWQDGRWRPRLKLSEQAAKITIPGLLQVRRFRGPEGFVADMIYDEQDPLPETPTIVDPAEATRHRHLTGRETHEDLLVPIWRGGQVVRPPDALETIRRRVQDQLAALHESVRRFLNPHAYPAGIEMGLHRRRERLAEQARMATEQGQTGTAVDESPGTVRLRKGVP